MNNSKNDQSQTVASEFKPGDTVVLKSGGPVMTVMGTSAYSSPKTVIYKCQWFAGKKLEHGDFPLAALNPAVELQKS